MKKVSKLQVVCAGVLVATVLAGAAWADFVDATMTAVFLDQTTRNKLAKDFADTPFMLMQASKDYLCIKQQLKNALSMGAAANYMAGYAYDSEGDLIAKKYVEAAKARGNTVRVYKPAINQIIGKKFYSPAATRLPRSREWFDQDRALIEFDKSGRIVSFMARAVQANQVVGAVVLQYTSIYLGPQNARQLENLLNNRLLEENFLREL